MDYKIILIGEETKVLIEREWWGDGELKLEVDLREEEALFAGVAKHDNLGEFLLSLISLSLSSCLSNSLQA